MSEKFKLSSSKYFFIGIIIATSLVINLPFFFLPAVQGAKNEDSRTSIQQFEKNRHSSSGMVQLKSKAEQNGSVRAIIELSSNFVPEGYLGTVSSHNQRQSIHQAQNRLMDDMIQENYSVLHRYDISPLLALEINPRALGFLNEHTQVQDIHFDTIYTPSLKQSVPHIEADSLHDLGDTGSGGLVAVLDTGIDTDHPALGDRLVSEACFSNTGSGSSSGDCPDGTAEQTGPGAGRPLILDGNPSNHGTHVGGSAVARSTSIPDPSMGNGVAKGANLASVMVFHENQGQAVVRSSDLIAGLEYVADTISKNHNVTAVNLSLGGSGTKNKNCDNLPEEPIISTLRSMGIPTVVASGNNSATNGINKPACISSAIAVGTTDISGMESIATFSNQSPQLLNFVTPGVDILSAFPDDSSGSLSGTSMSAPHLAGAMTLLKQSTDRDLTEIQQALINSGEVISDDRDGAPRNASYRSIRLNKALKPQANFRVQNDTPTVGEELSFLENSSFLTGSITGFDWSFGDGDTSAIQDPKKQYQSSGDFPVSLTISDSQGETDTKRDTVSVNALPSADFTFSPRRPKIDEPVSFNDASTDPDGTITSRAWTFGDGTTGDSLKESNRYSDSGAFTVSLTVKDNKGETDLREKALTVGNVYPVIDSRFVTRHARLSDKSSTETFTPSTEPLFKQVSIDENVDFDTFPNDLKSRTDSTCTNPSATFTFPLLDTGNDTVTVCVWTSQDRFSLLYGLRSDTASLNSSRLPGGIESDTPGLTAVGRTILMLEFGDSSGNLLGDTVSTSFVRDTFSYTLRYKLSEETTNLYEDQGISTTPGDHDFQFYYADTYAAVWNHDTSVDVTLESRPDNEGTIVTITGLSRDLPGSLGSTDEIGEDTGGDNRDDNCMIQRLDVDRGIIQTIRLLRDKLLNSRAGRWFTTQYYD